MGRACVQPGMRHVLQLGGCCLQGRTEGHQQRRDRIGSPAGWIHDSRRRAGISLRKETRSGELLSNLLSDLIHENPARRWANEVNLNKLSAEIGRASCRERV